VTGSAASAICFESRQDGADKEIATTAPAVRAEAANLIAVVELFHINKNTHRTDNYH
jgi:hypothetical protein